MEMAAPVSTSIFTLTPLHQIITMYGFTYSLFPFNANSPQSLSISDSTEGWFKSSLESVSVGHTSWSALHSSFKVLGVIFFFDHVAISPSLTVSVEMYFVSRSQNGLFAAHDFEKQPLFFSGPFCGMAFLQARSRYPFFPQAQHWKCLYLQLDAACPFPRYR